MRELLGKGATGDLAVAPLCVLVAEAYRREMTGCLSVEHGGVSRLYFRAGMLCGTQVFQGFKPLGQLLLELGWIDIDGLDRSLMEVARGKKQGEALIEMGLITREQLHRALDIQMRRNVSLLLALKDGRWRWSGDRPPPWTSDLSVDPVVALVDEFEAGLGPLAADTVLERELGGRRLCLSRRGAQWVGEVALGAADTPERLLRPLSAKELAEAVGASEARGRAIAAALLMAGCAWPEGTPAPAEEIQAEPLPDDALEPLDAGGELGILLSASSAAEVKEVAGVAHAAPLPAINAEQTAEPLPAAAIIADDAAEGAEALFVPEAPAQGVSPDEAAQPGPVPPAPRPAPSAGASDATVRNVRSRLLARAFQNLGIAHGEERPARPGPEGDPSPGKPVSVPLGAAPPVTAPGATAPKLTPEERLIIHQVEERHEKILHEDYFQRLQIPLDATQDAVKKAFFERALRFHPDRAVGNLAPLAAKMKEIFSALNEAYEVLSDSHRRAAYVRELAMKSSAKSGEVTEEQKEAARALFQKGQIQLRRRDYHTAQTLFKQAADLHPGRGNYRAYEAWCILADPVRPKADREKARTLLKEALQDKRSDYAHYVAGVLARLEEKWVDAEEHFRKAVEINDKNVEAMRELKYVRLKLEKEQGGGLFDRLRRR